MFDDGPRGRSATQHKEIYMKTWKKLVVAACLLAMLIPAFGCSEEGEMEKAGKKIDQMADDASDAAEEAAEKAKKIFD